MKLFSIFNTNKKLEIFVEKVLDQFCHSFPVEKNVDINNKKIYKKYDKAINSLRRQILEYRQQNKLGVYKKAKLIGLTIEGVEKRGYSQFVVEDIKKNITFYLTTNK